MSDSQNEALGHDEIVLLQYRSGDSRRVSVAEYGFRSLSFGSVDGKWVATKRSNDNGCLFNRPHIAPLLRNSWVEYRTRPIRDHRDETIEMKPQDCPSGGLGVSATQLIGPFRSVTEQVVDQRRRVAINKIEGFTVF